MFDFNITDELKFILKKLSRKDKKKSETLNKKIKQIINSDEETIDYYKNLRYGLRELKRVHFDKYFVLIFKVDIKNNFILFVDFDYHDRIYKK